MEAMSKNEHVVLSSTVTRQKPEVLSHLRDGVVLLLSRWNGLQLAVQNGWGGHDSLQKSHQLVSDILSWFSQSKGRLHVEDLENLLHESLLFSFNTEIEDGSIEEVSLSVGSQTGFLKAASSQFSGVTLFWKLYYEQM